MPEKDDRSWAIGLTNDIFQMEYQRRFPSADAIPTIDGYLADSASPVTYGIPDTGIDSIEMDSAIGPPPKKQSPLKGSYPCSGCGKVFSVPIARMGHERGCKAKIKEVIIDASQ